MAFVLEGAWLVSLSNVLGASPSPDDTDQPYEVPPNPGAIFVCEIPRLKHPKRTDLLLNPRIMCISGQEKGDNKRKPVQIYQ
jgi:hypothetical protein